MASVDQYTLNKAVPGYYTSLDAINNKDRRNTVKAGTYYVFNRANGAINVTTVRGQPGSWINPKDNTEDRVSSGGSSSSGSGGSSSGSSGGSSNSSSNSSGSNKKVYSPNKGETIPCYIINLTVGDSSKIEFECEPDEISDNNSAKFDHQSVIGRSSPYSGYDSSGPRNVSFSVVLHDDLCKEGILNTVNRLKSLNFPEYGGSTLNPPKALIHIGNMIRGNFVIESVNVTWKKPIRDKIYVQAEVSIDASEVVQSAYSASSIWSKGGYI